MNRKGFALVDLSVVTTVIAVTATLLLPALQSGKKRTQDHACRDNLRQLCLAWQEYTYDYYWTPAVYYARRAWWGPRYWWPDTSHPWPLHVYQYARDSELFYCPAAPPECKWRDCDKEAWDWKTPIVPWPGWAMSEQVWFSYAMTGYGWKNFDGWPQMMGAGGFHPGITVSGKHQPSPTWVSMDQIVNPSEMIVLCDSNADGLWDAIVDPGDAAATPSEVPSDRHKGASNLGFADGHVGKHKFTFLIDPECASHLFRKNNMPYPEM